MTAKRQSSYNNNFKTYSLVVDSYFENGIPVTLLFSKACLKTSHEVHPISETNEYTKTLGLEWNVTMDQFHLTVSNLSSTENVTKRVIVSDIAKIFDVLG